MSQHGLVPHLKGHVLLFDRQPPATYDPRAGLRLLGVFVLLEGLIGPRLWLWRMTGLSAPPVWVRLPLLLALALILVRFVAKVQWSDVGLKSWRDWSTTEKSYFVQVIIIANVVFYLLFGGRLRRALADPAVSGTVWVFVLTYLVWGFYQELVYRGILQTELVRRWGTVMGVLVSNVLYTFGPLHFYHFSAPSMSARLMMFAGIFAIGLFFGVVFRRSGNLWMVGVFHGIGDVYITGLGELLASRS